MRERERGDHSQHNQSKRLRIWTRGRRKKNKKIRVQHQEHTRQESDREKTEYGGNLIYYLVHSVEGNSSIGLAGRNWLNSGKE